MHVEGICDGKDFTCGFFFKMCFNLCVRARTRAYVLAMCAVHEGLAEGVGSRELSYRWSRSACCGCWQPNLVSLKSSKGS